MRKRIAIISIGDYRHITMISKYTDFFDTNEISYSVICTDRYNDNVKCNDNVIQYPFASDNQSKIFKFIKFIQFMTFAIKNILKNHYDFLVIWNENTAVLFSWFLLLFYKNRYCINIRDVDFLGQEFLNIIRKFVIINSSFSTYCSTSKLDFPKDYNYIIMRSLNLSILKMANKRNCLRSKDQKIRIGYLGKIRFLDADKQIIKIFGNDPRFELWFIGEGSDKLKEFGSKFNNVYFVGRYDPCDTARYLDSIDVINSFFGNRVLGYQKMSSIRFSYAPYLNIPVIVGDNTNMSEEGSKYGFSYAISYDVDSEYEADRFFEWYHNLNFEDFKKNCKHYCDNITQSDRDFYDKLKERFL